MQSAVEFKHFSLSVGNRKILKDISLSLGADRITALIGESGSGKTMLLRSCMALFEDLSNWSTSGDLIIQKDNSAIELTKSSPEVVRTLRKSHTAFVLQQSRQVLNPSIKLKAQLEDSMLNAGRTISSDEINKILISTGFKQPEDIMNRYPHQLSGGQIQRMLIAMAMLRKPSLLLVDEPTSNLDQNLKVEVLSLLQALRKETGASMIIVSHDLKQLASFCDDIAVIKNGELIESGSAKKILNEPEQEYTRQLISEVRLGKARPCANDVILSLDSVSKSYEAHKFLSRKRSVLWHINDVSFELKRGEILGLEGGSGSGKSTLARIMAGLDDDYRGNVKYEGKSMQSFTRHDLQRFRNAVKIIFQDPLGSLAPHLTGYDILLEISLIEKKKLNRKDFEDYIRQFGLSDDILDKRASQMSGGQRQRLLIARALLSEPEILICDEILSSLDASVRNEIAALLYEIHNQKQLSIVFISHDDLFLQRFCHRIIRMAAWVDEGVQQQ